VDSLADWKPSVVELCPNGTIRILYCSNDLDVTLPIHV
jgi:hypothetical protein